MSKEVFNRKELKYILDEKCFLEMQQLLNIYMHLDCFNQGYKPYRIHTLYIDTEDHQMIRHSLSKPKFKEKIRLRSYQPFSTNELVFFEIKKKYKGVGNKRRTKMCLSEALAFIETGEKPELQEYMNPQVINELAYILDGDKKYVKTYISYDRMAFVGKENSDLRITFDQNIKGCRGSKEIYLLGEDCYVMEIKAEKGFPLWLTTFLSAYHVYKQSFSKYGKEYQMFLQGAYQDNVIREVISMRKKESGNVRVYI
ncbi:MAG: polyphosphate polymerase domain-containing protein [Coprobacillaceae bacterium]